MNDLALLKLILLNQLFHDPFLTTAPYGAFLLGVFMEIATIVAICLTSCLGFISAVVMYLLAQKDARQAEQIKDLYEKHSEDSERLQKLELTVASNNYTKEEVNTMMEGLKTYIAGLFENFSKLLDERTKNL